MLKKASDTLVSLWKGRVIATLGRVGRWTLLVIVLCLALIGFLHLTRGTAVRHVRGVAADGSPISVSEPEFPLMATMATGAWLAPGNRVEVMLNGDGTYLHLWKDLRSAQQSITLQLYYGAALSTGTGRSTTNRHGSSSKTTWWSSTASSREFVRCCRATLKPSDQDQRGQVRPASRYA
jgi:hypothetical protein